MLRRIQPFRRGDADSWTTLGERVPGTPYHSFLRTRLLSFAFFEPAQVGQPMKRTAKGIPSCEKSQFLGFIRGLPCQNYLENLTDPILIAFRSFRNLK
jgi:hypothetical protein